MDPILVKEQIERDRGMAHADAADPVSAAVGSPTFSARHRFPDMRPDLNVGYVAGALAVSRFYFGVTPPVAVDVVPAGRRESVEVACKRDYCKQHGIRYVTVADIFDGASVRMQLAPSESPRPATPSVSAGTGSAKPPARSRRPRARAAA